MKVYRDAWRAANPEKCAAARKRWKDANKDKVMGYHLKDRYGMTVEEYEDMLIAAQFKCQICNGEVLHMLDPGSRTLKACVDHCHTTGKVRGILCHSCNRQLAFVESHRAAINTYLENSLCAVL